jgi:hypothetical protein
MGWIEEQFERRVQSHSHHDQSAAETRFELLAERKWSELVQGLQTDAEEYRRLGGDVALGQLSDNQVRMANTAVGVAATLIFDPSAHTIQYTYEPDNKETAVPEGGVFSMRRAGADSADLYSSDQRISSEQARRMVLEPLLFPNPPRVM